VGVFCVKHRKKNISALVGNLALLYAPNVCFIYMKSIFFLALNKSDSDFFVFVVFVMIDQESVDR
jgi:hypothetical protein